MEKQINLKHSLSFFFLHAITCIIYGFSVYTLKERGFSASNAGYFLAASSFIAIFLQIFLADICDKSKKISVFEMSTVCALLIFICAVCNYFIRSANAFLAIIFIIGTSLYIGIEPLINTLSSKFLYCGIKIDFAKARACGSISYAIFCFVLGYLSNLFSYKIIIIFFILMSLGLLCDLLLLRKDYQIVNNNVVITKEKISYKEFIKNNKYFVLLIVFLSFIYYGYLMLDNFMILIVENVGGNSNDLGSILGVKAIIEYLGILLVYPFFIKRLSLNKVLVLAAFMFLLKAILLVLSGNVTCLYLTQIIQCLSFSLMMPGGVALATKVLKEDEITRGQAFLTLACVFGSLFGSLTTGFIIDNLGVKYMEYMAVVASLVGFLGFVVLINKVNKCKNKTLDL